MRLRIKPYYGWGWFDAAGAPIDVPSEFEVELVESEGGMLPRSAVGHIVTAGHQLSDLWVLISQRHANGGGQYNLCLFQGKLALPTFGSAPGLKPTHTGFAEVSANS